MTSKPLALKSIHETARLNEFTEIEWFELCKILNPGKSHEEYAQQWTQYLRYKLERTH